MRQKDCQTVTKAKTTFSFEEREMLHYQAVHKFVNCASISAFISDPVFRVVLYIPECSLPIAAASFSQSVLSFHRD